jgi:O-antigen/teichoic acid export membrane protein
MLSPEEVPELAQPVESSARPALRESLNEGAPGGSSFTRSAIWILAGRVLSFAISTALPLLLVRRLDRHAFGLYKLAFVVVGTAANIFPLAFGMNVYYFLPRERGRQAAAVFNTILVLLAAGMVAAGVLIGWPGLLVFLSKDPEVLPYAPLIASLVAVTILSSFFETVPMANREMDVASAVIVCSQVLRTLFLLGATLFVGNVRSLFWAAIFSGCIQTMALGAYLASRFPRFWTQFDRALLRAQFSYALPLGVVGLMWILQVDLDNYFVSNRFGDAGFAIYSVGCFEIPLIGLLSEAAGSVLIPQMAYLQKHSQTEEMISLTFRAMRKIAVIAFPAYVFLVVTGHEFIAFLFTRQYASSWPIFIVNITLIPLSVLLLDPIMRAYAEYRHRLVRIRIALLAILLTSLWWSTGRFGMIGAIGSTVAVGILDRAWIAWMFGRALRFGWRHLPYLKDPAKMAACAAVAGVTAELARVLSIGSRPVFVLLSCAGVFVPAYLGLLWLSRVASQDEITFLRRTLLSPTTRLLSRYGADSQSKLS